jgi:hypothetical protein
MSDPGKQNKTMSNGKDNNNGKGNPYTPWLVIPSYSGDTGDRPLTTTPTPFYETTAIYTQQVSDGTINSPVVGEPSQVFAVVTDGMGNEDAIGVSVSFWWANPSIAITAASVHPIDGGTPGANVATGVTVPSGSATIVPAPVNWVPIEENGGHECLLAEAYLPFDPVTDPMQPVYDRHVGQKNEQLIVLPPGGMIRFPVEAHNPMEREAEVTVEVRPGLIPRNLEKRFTGRGLWRTPVLDPPGVLPLELSFSKQPEPRFHLEGAAARLLHRIEELLHLTGRGSALSCLGPPQVSHTITFLPREIRTVEIVGMVPWTAQPGQVYVLRISERIGEILMGGYTLYVAVAA